MIRCGGEQTELIGGFVVTSIVYNYYRFNKNRKVYICGVNIMVGGDKKMKTRNIDKKQTAIVLSIFAFAVLVSSLMVGTASAHFLYIDTNDKPDAPSVQAAKIIFGHPNSPAGHIVPQLKEVKQYRPDGTVVDLKAIEKANHSVAYFLHSGGVNIIVASREPSVYAGKLSKGDFGKILCCDGDAGNAVDPATGMIPWAKVTGQELEIVPLGNPFNLHVGDTFKAAILSNGTPINGSYAGAHGTKSIHNATQAQIGETAEDGTFSIDITEPGMWQVKAEHIIEKPGTWIATNDNIRGDETKWLTGDEVEYERERYRATLTFFALP
jgi:uncharacterized GH25 family protein